MNSPFDELGQQPDFTDEDKAHFDRLDYLIHKVFAQSDDGAELLEYWKEHLLMAAGAEPTDNDITIGMREGTRRFIRNIILTVRKVENE